MSRRAARFTEADARRAAKAAKSAGMAVRIDAVGEIWIVPMEAAPPVPHMPAPDPLAGKKPLVF